jgi:hydroxyacylglutathione hydrolase
MIPLEACSVLGGLLLGNMIFESVVVGPLQCNCYILGCEKTREALVIDPGDEIQSILPLLQKHDLKVKYILSTHAHIDHVGDLEKLKIKTGAQALLHERDLPLYQNLPAQASWLGVAVPTITQIDNFIQEGDKIKFGEHSGEILFTPGHTPGSLCLHLPGQANLLFAGDTLFQRSIGRTDLWGGSFDDIIRSIQQKLLVLDEKTIVYPGHGPSTTIAEEKQHNPFLQS